MFKRKEKYNTELKLPRDPKISENEDMFNAMTNISFGSKDYKIIKENGKLKKVWIKFFPDNTKKSTYLYIILVKSNKDNPDSEVENAAYKIDSNQYRIVESEEGQGFDIIFF